MSPIWLSTCSSCSSFTRSSKGGDDVVPSLPQVSRFVCVSGLQGVVLRQLSVSRSPRKGVMDYHKVPITCPKCGQRATLLDFCVRADSWVALECLCIMCSASFEWEAPTYALVIAANKVDERHPQETNFADMRCEGRPS